MTETPALTEGTTVRDLTELLINGQLVGFRTARGDVYPVCSRCGGSGHYSYNPLDGTRCFGCRGARYSGNQTTEDGLLAIERRRVQRKAAAARKEERRLARQEADRLAWATAHPEVDAALRELPEDVDDTFLRDMRMQASWRPLSANQTAAVLPAIEGRLARLTARCQHADAQRAAGHLGTVGAKIEADVEITFTKVIDSSRYGHDTSSVLVIMRTADGAVVKTFSSGEFGWSAERGQRLHIRGTVKAHEVRDGLPETMLTRVSEVPQK